MNTIYFDALTPEAVRQAAEIITRRRSSWAIFWPTERRSRRAASPPGDEAP